MEHATPAPLDVAAAPLLALFGGDLALSRVDTGVRWTLHGQTAAIDLGDDGRLVARFFAAPALDEARGVVAVGLYRPHGCGYALTTIGCDRMVADTVAFFSGVREPRFVFVDVV